MAGLIMAKINRRGAKYCLGQNWRYGGMKKNRARGKDKKVVSNPGPRPPYHALKITARRKSETGELSKKGQVTSITPATNAGVTSAAR